MYISFITVQLIDMELEQFNERYQNYTTNKATINIIDRLFDKYIYL